MGQPEEAEGEDLSKIEDVYPQFDRVAGGVARRQARPGQDQVV